MNQINQRIKQLEDLIMSQATLPQTNHNQSEQSSQVIEAEFVPFVLMFIFLNHDYLFSTSQRENLKKNNDEEKRNLRENVLKSADISSF